MTLSGGKRKVNKSLKSWVAFVKKVQKEEKLSYKDAIHRAKVRKDKGEKWMVGGQTVQQKVGDVVDKVAKVITHKMNGGGLEEEERIVETPMGEESIEEVVETTSMEGGRRRRRTMRRSRGRGRARTARRGRTRSSRKH